MMRRSLRLPLAFAWTFLVVGFASSGLVARSPSGDEASSGREIPSRFAPLEYLVGSWKGQGVSRDDPALKFRGWPETHAWAWSFNDGKPTGMTLHAEGSKLFTDAALTFDEGRQKFQLKAQAVGPKKAAIVYEGALDDSHKLLTLERTGVEAGQPGERLTLRANSNFIRYTLGIERKAPKGVQYSRSIEVGLTKEGESFAAGSSTTEAPKCIITGGASTLTVAYQGRTFPICCTGCRDEFLENPDKYVKKASLGTSVPAAKGKAAMPAPARSRGADDAFSDDVEEPSAKPTKPVDEPSEVDQAKTDGEGESSPAKAKTVDRAASLLRVGQNLEKAGKPAAALQNYRQIVKDYPKSSSVKTAQERIRALSNP